ncbi:hypothetical protein C2G38_2245504 [Gigaspora rosea]|uniref:Uncharacterized protein n=1 Tax=Gigaspora rosea TaxID=44941 RepID=A0A397VAZ3_9GLOM|nr:hypothetical protein C2G38_2245504 [Gigaspora rosea]
MYESSNRKFSTLSKANNSKSQKVNINNQSALATSVNTGLINDVVECAKSKMPLYNDFELQEDSESELQEFDYTPNVQEIEFKFQRESNPEFIAGANYIYKDNCINLEYILNERYEQNNKVIKSQVR